MRPSAFFVRVMAIGLLMHLYVGIRLIPAAPVDGALKWLAVIALAASVTLIPLGMAARMISRQPLSDLLAWAGLSAMGFFSSLLVLTVLRDIALTALAIAGWVSGAGTPVPAFAEFTALGVPALALLLSLLGLYFARRSAPVKTVDVPVAGLDAALDGFTIVQVSDIHIGPTIKRGYVEKIVATVNALKPDLIAVTGDAVDGSVLQLQKHTQPLADLAAPHGTFFVTGNHEYYSGADPWISEFRRLGLTVLMNEHVVIDHRGAQAVIAGVTDYGGGHFDPRHQSDPAKAAKGAPDDASFRLLLAHQPRSAPEASKAGFTLQLSGHTHGGQFLPWMFFVRMQQPFVHGLAKLGDLWVYTSRGTGYWGPPIRLFAPSEITRLRLVQGG
jgi:predicted MPP superfamily phosphohydrolase